ncbi:MAG: hypothetical protein FWC56_05920 [Phycisphaerae bacterium]|nr:hypothetical protein [Phycisphaerae bacterium]
MPTSAPSLIAMPDVHASPQTQHLLATALAEWRGEDFKLAGRSVTRLITQASPEERKAVSAYLQSDLEMTLAEFAAEAHWRSALAQRRGPYVRLESVTEYEKPELAVKLKTAYNAALQSRDDLSAMAAATAANVSSNDTAIAAIIRRESAQRARLAAKNNKNKPMPQSAVDEQNSPTKLMPPSPLPPASAAAENQATADQATAPEGQEFAVVDWWDRHESFHGTPAQAKALAYRTQHAICLLQERRRLDPAAKFSEVQRAWQQDYQRLSALMKSLKKPNRSKQMELDPKVIEAAQLQRQAFEKAMEEERKKQEEELAKVREQARKWQEGQEQAPKKAESKPGLFDWLKPKPKEDKNKTSDDLQLLQKR